MGANSAPADAFGLDVDNLTAAALGAYWLWEWLSFDCFNLHASILPVCESVCKELF
jgi:hypothetical protein